MFVSEFHFFANFREFYIKMIFISIKKQIDAFKDVCCSCYYFAKSKKCKHVYNFLGQRDLKSLLIFNIVQVKKDATSLLRLNQVVV